MFGINQPSLATCQPGVLRQSSGPNMWIAMKNILKQIKVHQYKMSHVAKQQEKREPTKELASMLCHLEKTNLHNAAPRGLRAFYLLHLNHLANVEVLAAQTSVALA